MPQTLTERLLRRVRINDVTGCWLWTGGLSDGYGVISDRSVNIYTHRAAYEMFHGPIPTGHDLHHLCERPACCNPSHVQPVTPREHVVNLTPGGLIYVNKFKTHCPAGHAYSPENTYTYRGSRTCKTCRREHGKRADKKRRARPRATRKKEPDPSPEARLRRAAYMREYRAKMKAHTPGPN